MSIIKNKKILAIILLFIVASIGSLYYFVIHRSNSSISDSIPTRTTSNEPSAQANFAGGDEQNKDEAGNTLQENSGTATITETPLSQVPPSYNSLTSSTGEIVVTSLVNNATIRPGQTVIGTSSLDKVSYRIIDSISGVIATGTLSVKEGKFSGTINYSTNAKEGRIDIFATEPDGREYSEIEIPIRFE